MTKPALISLVQSRNNRIEELKKQLSVRERTSQFHKDNHLKAEAELKRQHNLSWTKHKRIEELESKLEDNIEFFDGKLSQSRREYLAARKQLEQQTKLCDQYSNDYVRDRDKILRLEAQLADMLLARNELHKLHDITIAQLAAVRSENIKLQCQRINAKTAAHKAVELLESAIGEKTT